MSFRLHNVMGYGLDNIEKNDPRLNYSLKKLTDVLDSITAKEFATFLKLKYGDAAGMGVFRQDMGITLSYLKEKDYKVDMYNLIHYATETEYPKPLIFTPIHSPDWYRYGDSLDSYLHENAHGGPSTICEPIWLGIYPYIGSCKNLKNGREYNGMISNLHNYKIIDPTDSNFYLWEDSAKHDFNIHSKEEIDLYIRPIIPPSIRAFIRFIDLMDDEVIDTMNSYLHQYWS